MPLYEYKCPRCDYKGYIFEAEFIFDLHICPHCDPEALHRTRNECLKD